MEASGTKMLSCNLRSTLDKAYPTQIAHRSPLPNPSVTNTTKPKRYVTTPRKFLHENYFYVSTIDQIVARLRFFSNASFNNSNGSQTHNVGLDGKPQSYHRSGIQKHQANHNLGPPKSNQKLLSVNRTPAQQHD